MRLSLKTPLFALLGASLSSFACGHLGLEIESERSLLSEEEVGTSASGGAPVKDPNGSGGRDVGLGGAGPGSGGAPEGSGGLGTGGLGTGGATEGEYCFLDCPLPSTFLVHHTFENGMPPNQYLSAGSFIERTTSNVKLGTYALHTRIGGGNGEAEKWDEVGSLTSGSIYVRAWLYLPGGDVSDWIKILAVNGETLGGLDLKVYADSALELYSNQANQSVFTGPGAIPTSQWFCVQMRTDISNVNGAAYVWIDGIQVLTLSGVDTLPETGVNNVVYGIGSAGPAQTAASLYVDGYRVATEPLGCND